MEFELTSHHFRFILDLCQVDRLKSGLQSIAREVNTGAQNDVTALVKTVASELDCYVNARFTKVFITFTVLTVTNSQ